MLYNETNNNTSTQPFMISDISKKIGKVNGNYNFRSIINSNNNTYNSNNGKYNDGIINSTINVLEDKLLNELENDYIIKQQKYHIEKINFNKTISHTDS